MEGDQSIKSTTSKGAAISQASGGKIPYACPWLTAIGPDYLLRYSYPKHVWSPAGGWYAQPANWKSNTAIMCVVIFGLTAVAWKIGAEREHRDKMPEKGRFFPSR